MRKRSKKRVPQDIKAWVRSKNEADENSFVISTRQSTHWKAGTRRNRAVQILSAVTAAEESNYLLKSFVNISPIYYNIFQRQIKFFFNKHKKRFWKIRQNRVNETRLKYTKNLFWDCQQQSINKKVYFTNKIASLSKNKNCCAILGRARTFSRTLYIARHSMRKLADTGLISGLVK